MEGVYRLRECGVGSVPRWGGVGARTVLLHGWMMVERFICHVCLYGARGSAFFEPGQVKGHRWQPAGGGGASAAA